MVERGDNAEVEADTGGDGGSNNTRGVADPEEGDNEDGENEEEDNDTGSSVEKHAVSFPKKEPPVVLGPSTRLSRRWKMLLLLEVPTMLLLLLLLCRVAAWFSQPDCCR